ncbi:unnamed protein product [Soboliphyme baturini]|uniref:Genome assembly, chromosome: II n=1 Tax=Soboliphyme baturini TaxID=241478 RepID=A0A183IWK1_9BILA|nr:unnamed protein product [Soboliphyme baturini]
MTNEVETEWQLFQSGILEAAAECCGYKQVGLPPGGQKSFSWWTREVQLAVKEKKAAFKKWPGNKEPYTRVRYVKARKAAAKAVAKAKADSWKNIDHPPAPRKKKESLKVLKDRSGHTLTNDDDILRRWREYFEELLNPAQQQEDSHVEQKAQQLQINVFNCGVTAKAPVDDNCVKKVLQMKEDVDLYLQ